MKDKLIAALKRAAWTAVETAIAMIPVGVGVEGVNWLHILSVVLVATIVSLLKSVTLSMPEITLAEKACESSITIEENAEPAPEPNPTRPGGLGKK